MKTIFILLFLVSCYNTFGIDYICLVDEFDLRLQTSGLDRAEEKKLSNQIIKESGIKYNINSNMYLIVSVQNIKTNSFLSNSNSVNMENIELRALYTIIDKKSNEVLENGQIRVIDTLSIGYNRFANYNSANFIYDSLFHNLSRQLKDRTDLFLHKCMQKRPKKSLLTIHIQHLFRRVLSERLYT